MERERERWTAILIRAPQEANVSKKEDDKMTYRIK
jgi:hypothetical protein